MLTKLTYDPSIFKMGTIKHVWNGRAVHKSALSSSALEGTQEDGTCSLAKSSKWNSSCSCTGEFYVWYSTWSSVMKQRLDVFLLLLEYDHILCRESFIIPQRTCWSKSKLSTGHISIRRSPEVITHGTPYIVVAYLNSTLTRVWSITKSDVTLDTTYIHLQNPNC